jgi:hypothetical protein
MEQVRDELLAETATEERRYISAASAASDAVSTRAAEPLLSAPKHLGRQASVARWRLMRPAFAWAYGIVACVSAGAAGVLLIGHWWGPLSR